MATPEELRAQLRSLEEARSTGARRVRFQSHEVEYHSVEELERAIGAVKREMQGGSSPRIANVQAVRGYDRS